MLQLKGTNHASVTDRQPLWRYTVMVDHSTQASLARPECHQQRNKKNTLE